MAFTESEKVEIRRFCGYPIFGAQSNWNFGYRFSTQYGLLEYRMNNMLPEEEETIRTVYLPNLNTLEDDIPSTRDNIDTAQAAVWYRNSQELNERIALFDGWRRRLCQFIGIPPGPQFSSGGNVRLLV